MRPARRLLAAGGLTAAALAGAAAASHGAAPKPSTCEQRRACPSTTHAYLWRGLSCGLRRTAKYSVVVRWNGRAYHCRRVAATTTTTEATPAPATTTSPVVPAGPCAADTGYQPARALTISTADPGLHQQLDAPYLYRVTGASTADLRAAIRSCSPPTNQGFAGYTAWWVNWADQYATQPDGSCRLTRVTVGLHVNMALPAWTPGTDAEPGLAARWQTFVANLTTHEQGHADLAVRYAQKLLGDLEALSAADCASVVAAATTTGNADLAALRQASGDYDAQTGHGATQGASF